VLVLARAVVTVVGSGVDAGMDSVVAGAGGIGDSAG
jgi:hypothetical protein